MVLFQEEFGIFNPWDWDAPFPLARLFGWGGQRQDLPENLTGDRSDEMLAYAPPFRRPGYLLRGRPVTVEQATDIIRCTARLSDLHDLEPYRSWYHYGVCGSLNFDNDWFEAGCTPAGWCHCDGTIGLNGITYKYPNVLEYIAEWSLLARMFPYLDLMVLTLRSEEGVIRLESEGRVFPRKTPYVHDRDLPPDEWAEWWPAVERLSDVGLWVHDGELTLLGPKDAYTRYRTYEAQYSYDRIHGVSPGKPSKYSWNYYHHHPEEIPDARDFCARAVLSAQAYRAAREFLPEDLHD